MQQVAEIFVCISRTLRSQGIFNLEQIPEETGGRPRRAEFWSDQEPAPEAAT